MRLIDADKYKADLWVGHEYLDEDTMLTATNILDSQPTIEAVPLADIYRIIAGHSDYHGDNILAALTCIAEGKAVNPVKPLEAETVRHGRWGELDYDFDEDKYTRPCSNCGYKSMEYLKHYCPNCGANMDGDENA